MKNKLILFGTTILLLCPLSCSNFLEHIWDNQLDDEYIFSNLNTFTAPLMTAYFAIPNTFNIEMDILTDNAVHRQVGNTYNLNATGGMQGESFPAPMNIWKASYQNIRRVNQFLEHMVPQVDGNGELHPPITFFLAQPESEMPKFWRLYGEAYFVRAYYLSELFRTFAGKSYDGELLGVPLVGDLVLVGGDDMNIPRAPFFDCVQAIVNDCDSAIKHLPAEYKGSDIVVGAAMNGRASGIAAMALKARILLYAASPAFNPVSDALYEQRWREAVEAAAEAINAVGGLVDLVNTPPTGALDDIGDDYYFGQLQVMAYNDNGRDLFFRGAIQAANNAFESQNYSGGMNGTANINPTQNFVDAFPDKDGYPIDHPGATYDPQNPYANRDPRLALFVAYNGSLMGPNDYYTINTVEGELDAYDPLTNTSRTGYYLRKLLRPKRVTRQQGATTNLSTDRARIILGKPELYLGFAEAANEVYGVNVNPPGYDFSAKDVMLKILEKHNCGTKYLNEVIGNDKDEFRKYVRNCRRLDLSFEGHYYFDLRRWLPDANPEALRCDLYRVIITAPEGNSGTNLHYEYELLEQRAFTSPWTPIPYAELFTASAIKNNMGYPSSETGWK